MQQSAVVLACAAVFAWALVSERVRAISAPIFFVAAGVLLAEGTAITGAALDPHVTKLLAEVTLVWVLFADASRVRLSTLRQDAGRYVRLLGVGLPLTIVLGTLGAILILDLNPWYAILLGAALAPTDAALGAAVMTDRRVPYTLRQVLNVESGLNDGIATPIVTTALAVIVAESGSGGDVDLWTALLGLPIGALVGLAVGVVGGTALRLAHRHGWTSDAIAGPAVLALAVLAYVVAVMLLANGFVAAFVAGIAFGSTAGRGGSAEVYYVEQTCGLASMVCWMMFGALAVPELLADWSWWILVYAILSLTLVRIIPVALALLGSGIDRWSTLFIGWFGPRGLASVVFALIATEDLHDVPGPVGDVVAAIGLTVLLSVLLHGLTASPLVARYAATRPADEGQPTAEEVPVRHLVKPSVAEHAR